MEELADKLGFVQAFLFLHHFLFLLLSSLQSSVSLFYVSATALGRPCCILITVCYDLTRVSLVKERVCQLSEVCQREFAKLSLPCKGRLNDENICALDFTP